MRNMIRKLFWTEDWLAVWLGFFVIVLVLFGVRSPMLTFKWATEREFNVTVAELSPAVEGLIRDVTGANQTTRG